MRERKGDSDNKRQRNGKETPDKEGTKLGG
jgi:hypothetical protein